MVVVKEEYRNKGVLVLIGGKHLATIGLSNRFYLDVATKKQLEYLASIGHESVEIAKKKEKI